MARKPEANNLDICEIPRWQQIKRTLNNLNYKEFLQQASDDKDAVILDVRTSEEFANDKILDAQNVDYLSTSLADDLELLDKDKNYYIYCRTGRRSLRICVILRNLGFEKVFNLENGIVSK